LNPALKLERDGNIEKAKDYYEKGIELDGNRTIEAYYYLKSLYKKQGRFEDVERIETELLSLKPDYEVNHKFSDDLILLGYSLNEKEFELFNEGKTTFFWESDKQKSELSDEQKGLTNAYKIGNRYYEIKTAKNLAPNFGFEVDPIGVGFSYGWDTDIYTNNPRYYTPLESHQIIFEENPLGKTQCLSLTNTLSRCTNCQTDCIAVDENSFYLEAGWIKSINGNAYFGRRWFDSEKSSILYNYAASGISFPQWRFYSQVVIPPSNSVYCRLWVINYEAQGKAYFDNIIFIRLELPKLTKKE